MKATVEIIWRVCRRGTNNERVCLYVDLHQVLYSVISQNTSSRSFSLVYDLNNNIDFVYE